MTRLTREEKLARKAERMWKFTQGTYTPKPYRPLSAEQKIARAAKSAATRAANKAEQMFAFTQGTYTPKDILTKEQRKAKKAERMFAFTQGTYTPRPYKPLTAEQKIARAAKSAATRAAKKAEQMFAFTQGSYTPKERKPRLSKQEKMWRFTQGTYNYNPTGPLSATQKASRAATRAANKLYKIANSIPLPPSPIARTANIYKPVMARKKVLKQYDAFGRVIPQ